MRVVIGYPPLNSSKGIPLLAQNRQFQWSLGSWTAYPIIPAYAASMLKNIGHKVYWLDGISERVDYLAWEKKLLDLNPNIIFLETKTPVIKFHWEIINKIKKNNPKIKIILAGDHVTALPEESLLKSKVDYILTGGDYDFLLVNLCNHLDYKQRLEPGIWFKKNSVIKNTGTFKLNHNLDNLPPIDRNLTNWKLYAYSNSNYLNLPGTYTMFARDCWWGKCTFCSWTTLYPGKFCRTTSVKKAIAEIDYLVNTLKIKEIMDDSGTFPNGEWLREFCHELINKKYNQKLKIDCNLRFNSDLNESDFKLMAKAGFRLVLFGLESVNQKTLNKLNKNLPNTLIKKTLHKAKSAGLKPHLTVMVGYPWETKKDVTNTLDFAKEIFRDGLADSLQATIVIPYPGTPLFAEAKRKHWLKTLNWNRYDMKESILRCKIQEKELKKLVKNFYKSIFNPRFIFKKFIEALFDKNIFLYYLRLGFKFWIKLFDFTK